MFNDLKNLEIKSRIISEILNFYCETFKILI